MRDNRFCDNCCQYRISVTDFDHVMARYPEPIIISLCDACLRYKLHADLKNMCEEIAARKLKRLER